MSILDRPILHLACASLAVGMLAAGSAFPASAEDTPKRVVSPITGVAGDENWKEEYAFTLGVQAYTYAFPWYYNQLLRWMWVTQPPRNARSASMPMNTFWNGRNLTNAEHRDGGSPNNDTLYSVAWVDVSKEPIIISMPEMKDRYWSIELAGFDADNFDYIGTRATGGRGGHYLVAGPNWKGTVPKGVKAVAPSHTPMFLALVRTMVAGPQDLDAVHKLQDQFKLTPLSLWGKPGAKLPENRDVWAPYPRKDDPLADWKTINRAMAENPPPARDDVLVHMFATIHVGPGQDVEKADEATRRGLARALDAGKRMVTGAATKFADVTEVNGWSYFPPEHGRYGTVGNYIGRAATASLAGIVTNDLVEAMYPLANYDANGEHLNGAHKYTLRFAKDGLPPVNAFWSLTAYGMDYNLVDNPINRYSLGDRSNLKRDPDGGITLYVQKDSPGPDLESNWLPSGERDFYLVVRLYLPKPEALDGRWRLPALQRVD
jgi:hypothetical protein